MSETLPQAFLDRLEKIIRNKQLPLVLESFSKRKPTTFRVNTLRADEETVINFLTEQGYELEKAPLPNSYILRNKSQRELTETDDYLMGNIYIQGLSSMIPPIVVAPTARDLVLDACSSPGSKTTQMAALMENHGQIIANDMSRVRLYKLVANIKTLGVTNTQTIHMRAQELWKKFPSTFDRTLVDVPCSLEGRFLAGSPKTYANWGIKKIKILSDHQKHILRSAVSATKPGGTIVYSTCTLAPEENEEVVNWILEKEPSLTLEKIELPGVETSPGLKSWDGTTYSPEVEKCIRIIPNELFEGFFLAKFIRGV